MANLFGEDLKAQFAAELASELAPGTLSKKSYGARDPGDISGGPSVATEPYTFSGIIEDFSVNTIDGLRILVGDKKILILAGTLPDDIVPVHGDGISIDGFTGNVVRLIARDPAGATYTVQAR